MALAIFATQEDIAQPMPTTQLTYNRDDLRALLTISYPMIVSQGAFALMVFADRFFLSMKDPVSMAAALGGGVASFFTVTLFQGVLTYGNALVAQYYGAGEQYKCPQVATQGVLLAMMFLPLVAIVAFFVDQLFAAMGHDPHLVELEQSYYRIIMLVTPFQLSKVCLASYFSGIGRTRLIMIADLMGVALNIPLSYALIFGLWGLPELGIVGAAWGTVIASTFALAIFLFFYFSRAHRIQFRVMESMHLNKGIMGRYLRLGLPAGFELFMNIATFNLFLLLFQSFGLAYSAAAAIIFSWNMLSFVPVLGINIGVISLIGRYVGANDMSRANGVMTAGFAIAMGYTGTLALLFIIFRVELLSVFAGSGENFNEILDIGRFMMVGLGLYMVADALVIVAGAVLRGAGDTRWLMITSISLRWFMLAVQVSLIVGLESGPRPAWSVFVLSVYVVAAAYLWRLIGGKWREPERLARIMRE